MPIMDDPENLLKLQRTVLGAMLHDTRSVGPVLAELRQSDFQDFGCREIFAAIVALHEAGAPIETTALRNKLGDSFELPLEDVWACDTADVGYYVRTLKERTQLMAIASKAYDLAMAESLEDVAACMDKLNSMVVTRRNVEVYSAEKLAVEFLTSLGSKDPPVFYTTGIEPIDSDIRIRPGHMIVLGGYPSAGKTALSLQIALHMAKKWRVGYFSLETDRHQLTERIASTMSGVPLDNIMLRALSPDQLTMVAQAANQFAQLSFGGIESSTLTVRDIQSIALSRRMQIVFVDYLGLVHEKGANRYETVTNISIALHNMAQSTGITVIALAQLSRPETIKPRAAGEASVLTQPTMSSFRESGQIEQDADIAMLLYLSNPDKNTSYRILKVAKNKQGPRKTVELDFDGRRQIFAPKKKDFLSELSRVKREGREEAKAPPAPDPRYSQQNFAEIDDDEPIPF